MDFLTEHWIEFGFVIVYLVILAHHAWANKGTRFDAASNPYWIIAISFFATFVSTNTFIGHAGKSWDAGLLWYLKLAAYILFTCLSWFVIAPKFFAMGKKYGSRTIADFLGYHYRSTLVRRVAAIIIVLATSLYLVAVYKAASLGLQEFFNIDYVTSLVIIFVIVTIYTSTGGFSAVVKTDAWQGVFLAIGAVAVFTALTVEGGGLPNIIGKLRIANPEMVSWKGGIPIAEIIGLSLAGGIKMMVDPRQVSRFYGLDDQKHILKAGLIATSLFIMIYVLMLPIGAFARTVIPAEAITDSDQVMPYLLGEAKILGIFGSLLLLVLISAAMSTLDSALLVAASAADQDLFMKGESLKTKALKKWTQSKRKPHIPDTVVKKVAECLDAKHKNLLEIENRLKKRLTDEEWNHHKDSLMAVVNSSATARQRPWLTVISLLSMLLALNPIAGIVEMTAFAGSIYAACFLPTLVIGIFWRGSTFATMASLVLGAISVLFWFFLKKQGLVEIHEIYVGAVVGIAIYILFSLQSKLKNSNGVY